MRTESDSSSDGAKGYEAKAGRKWRRTSPGSRGHPGKASWRVRLWKIPGESPAEGRQGRAEGRNRQGHGRTKAGLAGRSAQNAGRRWDCGQFHLVPALGCSPDAETQPRPQFYSSESVKSYSVLNIHGPSFLWPLPWPFIRRLSPAPLPQWSLLPGRFGAPTRPLRPL